MSASSAVVGFSTHATHFVVLAALSGLLVLLRGQRTGKMLWFFVSGLLFGVAFLMKQPGLFFGLFAAGWLIWRAFDDKNTPHRAHLQMPFPARSRWNHSTASDLPRLILWRDGVFRRFWFWTVNYASAHSTASPVSSGWNRLNLYFTIIGVDAWFWILALLGFVLLLYEETVWNNGRKNLSRRILCLLLRSSLRPSFHFNHALFCPRVASRGVAGRRGHQRHFRLPALDDQKSRLATVAHWLGGSRLFG